MTADPASPRHPFEQLLEELTGRMSKPKAPLRHGFGSEEDARSGTPDRVIWVPNGVTETTRKFSDPNDTVITWLACRFKVNLYGGSTMRVYALVGELCGWLNVLLGQKDGCPASRDGSQPMKPGYDTGAASGPMGGTIATAEWASELPVTLYAPVKSVIYPLGLIVHFGLLVKAEDDVVLERP